MASQQACGIEDPGLEPLLTTIFGPTVGKNQEVSDTVLLHMRPPAATQVST